MMKGSIRALVGFAGVGLAMLWLLGPAGSPAVLEAIAPASKGETIFLFFGDAGTAQPDQYRVADAMLDVCRRLGCDFGLVLGDNLYLGSPLAGPDDPRLDAAIGDPYAGFAELEGFVFHVAMGNHDVDAGVAHERAYLARHSLFESPGLHFAVPSLPDYLQLYALHTTPIFKKKGAIEDTMKKDTIKKEGGTAASTAGGADGGAGRDWPSQLRAMEAHFCGDEQAAGASPAAASGAQATEPWRILFGHHPLFSSASGTPERFGSRLLPVVQRCGVDVYLAGHVHQQEHLQSPDVDQLIQGAAATVRPGGGWFRDHPPSLFRREALGFGVMRVTPEKLWVNFFDVDGALIYSWGTRR